MSCTAFRAASIRVMASVEPYVASSTAIEPVVSTATITSVALMARDVVGVTTLGVSSIIAAITSINVRRMVAPMVSSLEALRRRRTKSTISTTASTNAMAAKAPPTGHPKAGEKVNPFIVSASRCMQSR